MENENNLSVQEENRFKVVEIEKYNAELDAIKKRSRTALFVIGVCTLSLSLTIMNAGKFNDILAAFILGSSIGISITSLQFMIHELFRKVRVKQKIEDIDLNVEMYIDKRINEILDYVKVEAEKKLQEQTEMKQDLTNDDTIKPLKGHYFEHPMPTPCPTIPYEETPNEINNVSLEDGGISR